MVVFKKNILNIMDEEEIEEKNFKLNDTDDDLLDDDLGDSLESILEEDMDAEEKFFDKDNY